MRPFRPFCTICIALKEACSSSTCQSSAALQKVRSGVLVGAALNHYNCSITNYITAVAVGLHKHHGILLPGTIFLGQSDRRVQLPSLCQPQPVHLLGPCAPHQACPCTAGTRLHERHASAEPQHHAVETFIRRVMCGAWTERAGAECCAFVFGMCV